jgi:uncharacterized protein YbjT (DUF2867 family)
MSAGSGTQPLLLVVGGCGGLVGRAVLEEFSPDHRIRSVHRHPVASEAQRGVEWVSGDAGDVADWGPALHGVDTVLVTAWLRQASRRTFARLGGGLVRLVRAADRAGVRRLVHLSVPDAPQDLERSLPYLAEKRAVDRAVRESSVRYSIVRPTMLFGEKDRLLSVLLRLASRYRRLPMFGDGSYHVSPLAARDLARIVRREGEAGARSTIVAGGPRRWEYRELTDELFRALSLPPKYVSISPRNSVRLARVLEGLGSSLVYAYEIRWLLSDLLGTPAYAGLPQPLAPVESFLAEEARRLRGDSRGPRRTGPSG